MNDSELETLQRRVADLQVIDAKKWRDCEAAQATLWRSEHADPTSNESRRAGSEASRTLDAWVASRRDLESAVRNMMTYVKKKAGILDPNN